MARAPLDRFLTWLLLPAAFALVASALTLSRHAHTGLSLREGRVATVVPGGPGDRAGLRPGDRLRRTGSVAGAFSSDVLEHAVPGRPLDLVRERSGASSPVWLVPEALPGAERRFRSLLITVACVFLLLGGWVWSERRDRLARVFLLLCIAFSGMLTPSPSFESRGWQFAYDLGFNAAQLCTPVLFAHFFALFPEPPRHTRAMWVVRAGYALATALFLAWVAVGAESVWGAGRWSGALSPLSSSSAGLFLAGILAGLVLFAISFSRARSTDARRRLRVAFFGTLLGAAPIATLIAVRNLSPGTPVAGERAIVASVLLVPASFAWAIAVHRVFDFRVALRAGATTLLVGAAAFATYLLGEWIAHTWWPALGQDVSGVSLALLALVAALAGPSRPWLVSLGERVVPIAGEVPLASWTPSEQARRAGDEAMLAEACAVVAQSLRLDGCAALRAIDGRVRTVVKAGMRLPATFGAGILDGATLGPGVHPTAEMLLPHEVRDSLDFAGVQWCVPVPGGAALLLGRRMAGPWLDRHESRDLDQLVHHLGVALENAELRREARGRAALDRELEEAHRVQLRRLPRRTPVYPTLDCAACTLSTETVGGDYYDFIEDGPRDFTLAVGDAAGHGVPAAIVLAGVQSRFRDEAHRARHPGELLEALNRDLVALEQPEKFMGLLCARVDAAHGTVHFANGGITPPLVRRASGALEEWRDSGLLLGVSPEARYGVSTVTLGPGDIAVVHTDGLTEASRNGELFGSERLGAALDRAAHRRAGDIVEELLQAVRAWANEPLDDLTIVVLKQLTGPLRPAGGKIPLKSLTGATDT